MTSTREAPHQPNMPPDTSRGDYALISHSVLTCIAIIVVVFRCSARITSSGIKLDDCFMVAALLSSITNLAFTIIGHRHGVGRHVFYLEPSKIVDGVRTLFMGEFLLLLALCFVKVSVILFLLNFSGLNKWIRRTLLSNLLVICASTLAFAIILWIQCTPMRANWTPNVPGAHCISIKIVMRSTYAVTAITIVTDFLCALLPLPIIWRLRMDRKSRLSIMAIIALGLFAAACSIVRIVLVKDMRHSREDPTWVMIPLGVWTVIELHIAIIIASLPPADR